jgi:excisionase family DNA binding protein
MTNRRPIGANGSTGSSAGEDDLKRLVRLIARQAAQEAFDLFRDALETCQTQAGPPADPLAQHEASAENTADQALQLAKSGERFLSVAEVAVRLDVSEKTVRRKIHSGDLPAHHVGKLLRVSERELAASVARTRVAKGRRT